MRAKETEETIETIEALASRRIVGALLDAEQRHWRTCTLRERVV